MARQNNATRLADLRKKFSVDPEALAVIQVYADELQGFVFVSEASASEAKGKKPISAVESPQPLLIQTSAERADAIGQLVVDHWKVITDTLQNKPASLKALLAKITVVLLNNSKSLGALEKLLRNSKGTTATIKARVVVAALQENW